MHLEQMENQTMLLMSSRYLRISSHKIGKDDIEFIGSTKMILNHWRHVSPIFWKMATNYSSICTVTPQVKPISINSLEWRRKRPWSLTWTELSWRTRTYPTRRHSFSNSRSTNRTRDSLSARRYRLQSGARLCSTYNHNHKGWSYLPVLTPRINQRFVSPFTMIKTMQGSAR